MVRFSDFSAKKLFLFILFKFFLKKGNASSEAETNKDGEENKKEIEKTNSKNNLKENDKKQENSEEKGSLSIVTEGIHRVNQQPNSHRGENREGGTGGTQTAENNEDSKSTSSDLENLNFGSTKVSKQDTGEPVELGESTQQPGANEENKKELNKIKSQEELLGVQKGEEGDEKSGRDSAPDKFDSISETEEEDPTKSGDKDKKKKRERKKREKSKSNLFELDKKSRKKLLTASVTMSAEGSESSTSKTSKKEDSQSLDASVDKERSSSKKKDRRDKRKKSVERSSRGKVKTEKSTGDKKEKDKIEKDKLDKIDPPLGEDDDPDKKKKVKRGIFSIKKKSSSSAVNSPISSSASNLSGGLSPVTSPKGNVINKKNSSPSINDPHSITSFVSGRWRKSKKSLSSLTPNIKFEKSPTPPNINTPSHNDTSNSKDIQFESVNDDNDSPSSSFVNITPPSPAVSFPHLSSTGGSSANLLSASHKYDKEFLASSLPHTLIPSLSTDSIFNLKDFDSPISLPSLPPSSLHVSTPPPPPPLHFDPPLSFDSDLPLTSPDDLQELVFSFFFLIPFFFLPSQPTLSSLPYFSSIFNTPPRFRVILLSFPSF